MNNLKINKSRFICICCLLYCLCYFYKSEAQVSSDGKVFWVTYLENIIEPQNGNSTMTIVLSSKRSTQVLIQTPAAGYAQTLTLQAGIPLKFQLPNSKWFIKGSERIDNKGILITSDEEIEVLTLHYKQNFSEATKVYSEQCLGINYRIITHPDDKKEHPTSFAIVSTSDNNEIEITPSSLTEELRAANKPFVITLYKGQTYQVKSPYDLTGSTIKSINNKAIAVFSGAQQANIGVTGCKQVAPDSHLYEQLLPIEFWGNSYIATPFARQRRTKVRILKGSINDKLYINNQLADSSSIVVDTPISKPILIYSDKPFQVAAFTVSQICSDSNDGDPNMVILHPLEFKSKSQYFFSYDNRLGLSKVFNRHFINIVAQTNSLNLVKLDGKNIDGHFNRIEADSQYSFARVEVDSASHLITSDSGFQATVYGISPYEVYAYQLGFQSKRKPIRDNDSIPIGQGQTEFKLDLFPNPTSEAASLRFYFADSLGYDIDVHIFDAIGKLIYKSKGNFNKDKNSLTILTYNWASGVYWVDVLVNSRQYLKRLLVK